MLEGNIIEQKVPLGGDVWNRDLKEKGKLRRPGVEESRMFHILPSPGPQGCPSSPVLPVRGLSLPCALDPIPSLQARGRVEDASLICFLPLGYICSHQPVALSRFPQQLGKALL